MNAEEGYRTLLRLYPGDFQALFGTEMLIAFGRAAGERRGSGKSHFTRFLLAEYSGLLAGTAREWIAKWTTDNAVRGRCLPDVRMMRPPGVSRELWFAGASREYDGTSLCRLHEERLMRDGNGGCW